MCCCVSLGIAGFIEALSELTIDTTQQVFNLFAGKQIDTSRKSEYLLKA